MTCENEASKDQKERTKEAYCNLPILFIIHDEFSIKSILEMMWFLVLLLAVLGAGAFQPIKQRAFRVASSLSMGKPNIPDALPYDPFFGG